MITVPLTSNPTSNTTASPFQHPGSRQRIDRQVLSETVSGLRISAVDGTAFIDNAAALSAYYDGKHQITITDTAGKELVGVLGSVGSGEALGSELVSNGDFSGGGASWSSSVGTITFADGTAVFNGDGTTKDLQQSFDVAAGKLYALGYQIISENLTGSNTSFYLSSGSYIGATQVISKVVATSLRRDTAVAANPLRFVILANATGGALVLDNVSLKQVTSPSTTGALIKASPTGAQSFTSKDADFAYNAVSYAVTVKRIYL